MLTGTIDQIYGNILSAISFVLSVSGLLQFVDILQCRLYLIFNVLLNGACYIYIQRF